MEPIVLPKSSNLLKLPEQLYGTIKRVGILNKEPILYGDVNLLKPNDLYYINGAKLIYRYVKASIEDSSITYYFDTIKSMATDGLSVPEDERGHIRNAGYLFKEIIYSGDPNLVKNGNLFYHDTLPYISIVSNVDGVINLSTKELNDEGEITTVVTEYRVSPESLHDYSKDYLTFEALEDGTFSFRFIGYDLNNNNYNLFSYSLDNGETWSHHDVVDEYHDGIDSGTIDPDEENAALVIITPTVLAGSKLLLKGYGHYFTQFENFVDATCDFNVSGNIYTLMRGEQLVDGEIIEDNIEDDEDYDYSYMFYNCTHVVSAENLYLSKLTNKIKYTCMFYGCTKLTTAPKLPIVDTLVDSCYSGMFNGCTSLTTAPELPATTLTPYCYNEMFQNCSSLTTAPELSATTLTESCYYHMFRDCTSLTKAPELPATTLAQSCYVSMFSGCTSLTTAPVLPATTLATSCYSNMFRGCTSLTTAPELPATTLATSCYYYMFYGCTSLTTPPKTLPATTLASTCYQNMFINCTSLTTAPELSAITLVSKCYENMFNGCTNLNHIKALFTTTPSNTYTKDWVKNVAATGTFVKNVNATWTNTGTNAVPSGWTIETADPEPSDEITI